MQRFAEVRTLTIEFGVVVVVFFFLAFWSDGGNEVVGRGSLLKEGWRCAWRHIGEGLSKDEWVFSQISGPWTARRE